jgi:hypothetical protein
MSVSRDQKEPHLAEVMSAAKGIRRQLSEKGIKGGVTVIGGGQGPKVALSVFHFHGVSTSELAQGVIAHLEDMGCGCASSGEDDVQCTCND